MPYKKLLLKYLIITGIIIHILALVGWHIIHQETELSLTAVINKAAVKLQLITKDELLVHYNQRFEQARFTETISTVSPRIFFPELQHWDGLETSEYIKTRHLAYKSKLARLSYSCDSRNLIATATCWIYTADKVHFAKFINQIRKFTAKLPKDAGSYGNAWKLAIAFDIAKKNPDFSLISRQETEKKLLKALHHYLKILDGDSASLWHNRASLAAASFIIAVALGDQNTENKALFNRALGYFKELQKSLALTEAWPGGYNYWIQNRGLVIAIAFSAYLNGIENISDRKETLTLLEKIGYWHIYATRPDNRIEGLGDEGSRVDLKDETRRVIDLLAQLTKNSTLATYSNYLERLHGNASYYRAYRWGFLLFNDPFIDSLAVTEKNLSVFNNLLPDSEIFGSGAMNQIYIRSDWGSSGTFISFRSGANFTHHGHADAGHFSIFKTAPLAINSSVYGDFFSQNRLSYSIRSIAKNTLLIQKPGEEVNIRHLKSNVSDGGQRIVMPTGSSVNSVDSWKNNLSQNKHFEGGELSDYIHNKFFTYINSDLTRAYNSNRYDDNDSNGKVKRVKRQLLYLKKEDILFVFDNIITSNKNYKKKWLLHSINKPELTDSVVLKGNRDNGILESNNNQAIITNKNVHLLVKKLLPTQSVIRLVGGEDFKYYIESDADDSQLDGLNYSGGAKEKPWFDNGQWRLEIQPSEKNEEDYFLVALQAYSTPPTNDNIKLLKDNSELTAIMHAQSVIIFMKKKTLGEKQIISLESAISQVFIIGQHEKGIVEFLKQKNEPAIPYKTSKNKNISVYQFINQIDSKRLLIH